MLDGDDGAQDDDDNGEEEVFALNGMPQSDSEQSEEEEDEDGEDEDVDMEDAEDTRPPQKKAAKAKGKPASRQDLAKDAASDKSDDEDEEQGWGDKKSAYYSTNAEELDSEDDEANELEEQEARRLQSKSRDVMNEDDFGMGDVAEPDLLDDPIESVRPSFLYTFWLTASAAGISSPTPRPKSRRSHCPRTRHPSSGTWRKQAQRLWRWPTTGTMLPTNFFARRRSSNSTLPRLLLATTISAGNFTGSSRTSPTRSVSAWCIYTTVRAIAHSSHQNPKAKPAQKPS